MAQPREGVAGAGAVRASEDHAVNEVPDSERSTTLNITLVRMGFTVSATDLLFGMSLALSARRLGGDVIAPGRARTPGGGAQVARAPAGAEQAAAHTERPAAGRDA